MKLCTELPSSEDHGKRIILLFYNFADLHKWWVDAEYDKATWTRLRLIMGKKYQGYKDALSHMDLDSLMALKFMKKIFEAENILKILKLSWIRPEVVLKSSWSLPMQVLFLFEPLLFLFFKKYEQSWSTFL